MSTLLSSYVCVSAIFCSDEMLNPFQPNLIGGVWSCAEFPLTGPISRSQWRLYCLNSKYSFPTKFSNRVHHVSQRVVQRWRSLCEFQSPGIVCHSQSLYLLHTEIKISPATDPWPSRVPSFKPGVDQNVYLNASRLLRPNFAYLNSAFLCHSSSYFPQSSSSICDQCYEQCDLILEFDNCVSS